MEIGFIGTGSMGKPMARNLIRDGHHLTVYNRTAVKTNSLVETGATSADTPAKAAKNNDVVITMVSNDEAMTDVVFGSDTGDVEMGDGLIETLDEQATHLAMSTISPTLSRQLFKAHEDRRQRYVAAPVFGKPDFASEGTLSVVGAGRPNDFEECTRIFEAVGRQYFHVGDEPFKANIIKLAGNFTIAAMMETLGETFTLMKKSNINPDDFLTVINKSLYDSPLYENYGSTMIQENYEPPGFKMELGLKDMRLTQETAREQETPMPLLSLVHDQFLSGVAGGNGGIDWAGLGKLAEQRAGIK